MSIGVIFEDIFCIAILDMMIECQETPYVKDYTCGPPPLDRTAQIYPPCKGMTNAPSRHSIPDV
jgi:hypothetical protein